MRGVEDVYSGGGKRTQQAFQFLRSLRQPRAEILKLPLGEAQDDRDLTLTDYELLDVKLAGRGDEGVAVSRVSWVRLPSVTEHTAEITSRFEFRDGAWYLRSQDAGPFLKELSPP